MCSNYIGEPVNFSPAGALMYTHEPTPGFSQNSPLFPQPALAENTSVEASFFSLPISSVYLALKELYVRLPVQKRATRMGGKCGSTRQALLRILIFTKATCDNAADAEWGFKSPPPDGGPRTLLAAPLTPWTCASSTRDRE